MRGFVKEFKDFVATGNMVELAVAVILGAAVGAVIKAFTEGIVMQLVAAVVGKPDFSKVTITLRRRVGAVDPVTGQKGDAVLQIGTVVNTLITLIVTGFVLFLLIKGYNRMRQKAPESVGPTAVEVLQEIRDE